MRDLRSRLSISTATVVIAGLLIWLSPYPLIGILIACLIATLAAVGVWEYARLAEAKNFHPDSKLMIVVAVAEVISFYFSQRNASYYFWPLIVFYLGSVLFFLAHFRHSYKALAQIAIEVFGIIYIAIPLCFMLGVLYPNAPQDGRWWLMYLIVTTKITDVGAYFVGRLFGKRKLAPLLSPKKTIEGAVAGFLCTVIASLAMAWVGQNFLKGSFDLSWIQAIWLSVIIAILAQLGDLAESLLKRDAFVKDSNRLPGLGGVLDVVDSLLFTAPVVYFYLSMS